MRFDVLTLFPEVFHPYFEASILGRGQTAGLVRFGAHNIRDYARDKHKTVDDTPYGGGPGMIMKIEPIHKALEAVKLQKYKIVVLSARGEQFTQARARAYAAFDQLILICGRYEGIDQRVADHLADEEISIGPYVLAGGEAAAMAVIEATARLIPGVLGNEESLVEESYARSLLLRESSPPAERSGEYPQYTRPEVYRGWKVPEVLLSGNHEEIKKWREEQ